MHFPPKVNKGGEEEEEEEEEKGNRCERFICRLPGVDIDFHV